jgi:hypothetical protein
VISTGFSGVSLQAHAKQLRWLLEECLTDAPPEDKPGLDRAQHLIDAAEKVAPNPNGRAFHVSDWRKRWLRLEEAWQLLHVADEALLTVARDEMLAARRQDLLIQGGRWLSPDDARVKRVEEAVLEGEGQVGQTLKSTPKVLRYEMAALLHAIHHASD